MWRTGSSARGVVVAANALTDVDPRALTQGGTRARGRVVCPTDMGCRHASLTVQKAIKVYDGLPFLPSTFVVLHPCSLRSVRVSMVHVAAFSLNGFGGKQQLPWKTSASHRQSAVSPKKMGSALADFLQWLSSPMLQVQCSFTQQWLAVDLAASLFPVYVRPAALQADSVLAFGLYPDGHGFLNGRALVAVASAGWTCKSAASSASEPPTSPWHAGPRQTVSEAAEAAEADKANKRLARSMARALDVGSVRMSSRWLEPGFL
eukprot:CAMPEP_0204206182 /NCGR_PEP_ID=MMETSP0361-20130328/70874_1 /ASSEMBLY_ACC=CAM_ASM_000343 /TAXON_ID=268821 /ORGANISM="Scrippsiella Hangoei, Strain SHTV-5" /LENGTH=261 /DNA_ID=CAMNT_0051169563 /DNA_START=237 /DNA_END=1020 /DNA_ORIENTATION=-